MTKSSIYTVKNTSVRTAEFAIWKIIVTVRMYPSLKKIIKNVKTSTMFAEIEPIGHIRQNRETNSNAVKEQKRIIEIEIQELRTTINTHLDKLQDDLMKELTEAEKLITEETRELLVSLDEKQKELT